MRVGRYKRPCSKYVDQLEQLSDICLCAHGGHPGWPARAIAPSCANIPCIHNKPSDICLCTHSGRPGWPAQVIAPPCAVILCIHYKPSDICLRTHGGHPGWPARAIVPSCAVIPLVLDDQLQQLCTVMLLRLSNSCVCILSALICAL